MGKKSTPKVPDAYDLEELLKYNTDLNRFDSVNPFGSQTWDEGPGGKWTMTQAISPELQGLMDQQMAFVNQGATPYERPAPMQDMQQALMDKRAALSGATPGYHPDVPQSSAPRPVMPGVEGAPQAPQGESMMPGHTADQPQEQGMGGRLAEAMAAMNDGQGFQVGQGGFGMGSAIGAAIPGIKAAYDKYKNRGEG